MITFDISTAVAVALSNGDLTATNTGGGGTDQGVKTNGALASGLRYFEMICGHIDSSAGNQGFGVAIPSAAFPGLGNNAVDGAMLFKNGNIYAIGSLTGFNGGASSDGMRYGVAVNKTTNKAWFKDITNAGFWNGNAGHDPATGAGGISIPTGDVVPAVVFGGGGSNGQQYTLVALEADFLDTPPSGFTAWDDDVPLESESESEVPSEIEELTATMDTGVAVAVALLHDIESESEIPSESESEVEELTASMVVGVAVAVVLSHESESESESESEPTPPRPPPVQVCVVSG